MIMSPVWTPQIAPPRLDKYCHLSHDAQRVMVAIHADYVQQRRKLMESKTMVTDGRSYYRSLYESRFGLSKNNIDFFAGHQIQQHHQQQLITSKNGLGDTSARDNLWELAQDKDTAGSLSRNANYKETRNVSDDSNSAFAKPYTARRLEFHHPEHTAVPGDRQAATNCIVNPSKSNHLPHKNKPACFSNTDRFGTHSKYSKASFQGNNVQSYDCSSQLSVDTSNYSDSPPIETQDYRILSQFLPAHNRAYSSTYDCTLETPETRVTTNEESILGINTEKNTEPGISTRNVPECNLLITDTQFCNATVDTSTYAREDIYCKNRMDKRTESSNYALGLSFHESGTFEHENRCNQATLSRDSCEDMEKDCNTANDKDKQVGSDFDKYKCKDSDATFDGSQCLFSQDNETPVVETLHIDHRSKKITKNCAKLAKKLSHLQSFEAFNKDSKGCVNNNSTVNVGESCDRILSVPDAPSVASLTFALNFVQSGMSNASNSPMFGNKAQLEETDKLVTAFEKLGSPGYDQKQMNLSKKRKKIVDKSVDKVRLSNGNESSAHSKMDDDDSSNDKHCDRFTKRCEVVDNVIAGKSNEASIKEVQTTEYLDESPYCDRVKGVYPMFMKKTRQHPAVASVSGSSDSNSGIKRNSGTKGFEIPFKKSKTDNRMDNTDRKICSKRLEEDKTCIEISKLPRHSLDKTLGDIVSCTEVTMVLVYSDRSTQLRDALFSNTKKQQNKSKQHKEVVAIAVMARGLHKLQVYVFPVVISDTSFKELLKNFWRELLSAEVRKVGFNVKELFIALLRAYDLEHNTVSPTWLVMDACVAAWLLDPDSPVSLFHQMLSMLNMPEQAPSDCGISVVHEDMLLLRVAMEKLGKRLCSCNLWDLYICVETQLTLVLAGMEMREIHIATHTLLHFSELLKKKLSQLEKQAYQAAGHSFLLNSHPQLRQVLFEELQLDTKLPQSTRLAKTSVGREPSTSETVLTQLSPFHPLPGIVLEYRQLQKLKSTYVDGILTSVRDCVLTTHWDQTAAATGRLTAYQPNIQAIPKVPVSLKGLQENFTFGKGSNQEIDIKARDAFISPPDHTLLAADFQQIELRLLGHLADDSSLIQLFSDPSVPDIFNALTAQWLGKPVTRVSVAEREQAKRIVYSVMYGAGKEKLAEYLKTSASNAKAIIDSFLLKFPAVSQFTKSCVDFCRKNGYTCSIFKRRRLFPNIKHGSSVLRAQAERQCVNFCVQGSAADICKAAMLQVESALANRPELRARLLVQIHDELLLEVADQNISEVIALVKGVMESPEKLCGSMVKLRVPIPVSVSLGKTWGQLEEVKGW